MASPKKRCNKSEFCRFAQGHKGKCKPMYNGPDNSAGLPKDTKGDEMNTPNRRPEKRPDLVVCSHVYADGSDLGCPYAPCVRANNRLFCGVHAARYLAGLAGVSLVVLEPEPATDE